MKRAFVKAERVRYKTICIKHEDYLSYENRFRLNLLRRGYPSEVLDKWFKESLERVEKPTPQFVLPSEYNPIWEYIRIGPIREVLVKYSKGEIEGLDILVTSLKWGRNYYDSFNLHNLTVLNSLDLLW